LLRQLGDGQFHGATNWDAHDAFGLVDPGVGIQRLISVFARRFQIFHPFFRARLFVITSAWRRSNYCQHDYAEQCEEKHHP
jgi:hypothetical protein